MKLITQPRIAPKCARCGEELNCPYEFEGGFYGYTCIKIVNPSYKRSPKPAMWVKANTYTIETLENGNQKIRAEIEGVWFMDFNRLVTFTNKGVGFYFSKLIIIQKETAFVNILGFKINSKVQKLIEINSVKK